ncbi:MAG: fimbrillin family protein [Bacteroidaceae bacterium]|nr:fimbrillin family protein [Bacteroidaceae bacterium]
MRKYISILTVLLLLAACSSDEIVQREQESHEFTLTTDVLPFKGETAMTRSKLDGTGFEDGDWIRLKIICPYSSSSEYGESTWGNSYDAFFLMKRKGGSWVPLDTADHCDISGTYNYSGSPQVGSFYEAQQTPYVYMASTWSEEKNFRGGTKGGFHVLQYSHVFHADQRKGEHYKASDLLWGQQYMQTGSWNVHINFEHKMACITFELTATNPSYDPENPESSAAQFSSSSILTLEGMPNIDQQEVLVGDYYADRSKINSRFGYREKNSCNYEHNGKVIGIGVNKDNVKSTLDNNMGRAVCVPMTGNPNPAFGDTPSTEIVPNTGVYTAYKVDNTHFRMIVPPCELKDAEGNVKKAKIWVRDGERRFEMELPITKFQEGELYPVKVIL